MRMRNVVVLLCVICIICSLALIGAAQSASSSGEAIRKVVRRVDPMYPEMAKRMSLSGTVKVFAVVAPDGTVKAVEPVGGSPLPIQSAHDAIMKWKFAPAAAESKELVEFRFHPE